MPRKTGGNGHGPDEPDERGLEIIRQAGMTPKVLAELEKRRKAAEARQRRAEARAKAAEAKKARKEAAIKARLEKKERKAAAQRAKEAKQRYKDVPPEGGR